MRVINDHTWVPWPAHDPTLVDGDEVMSMVMMRMMILTTMIMMRVIILGLHGLSMTQPNIKPMTSHQI